MYTQTPNANIQKVSHFSITLVKKAYKARTFWYHQTFCLIDQYQIDEKSIEKRKKKEWTETILKKRSFKLYKFLNV